MKVTIKEVQMFEEGNFFFKTKPKEKFEYVPGQFVMVKIGKIAKPFSIAVHDESKTVDFLISLHPDGELTPKLAKLKAGDSFEISEPYGSFCVKPTKAKEIIFIAAGTGIAPFRAMIPEALELFPEKKIKLIFGFRYDYYFEKEWKELEEKNKNFKACACCSRPGKFWKGFKGRVTEHLEAELGDAKDKEVYLCGPPQMVESTQEVLKKIGFKDKQIHVERW